MATVHQYSCFVIGSFPAWVGGGAVNQTNGPHTVRTQTVPTLGLGVHSRRRRQRNGAKNTRDGRTSLNQNIPAYFALNISISFLLSFHQSATNVFKYHVNYTSIWNFGKIRFLRKRYKYIIICCPVLFHYKCPGPANIRKMNLNTHGYCNVLKYFFGL